MLMDLLMENRRRNTYIILPIYNLRYFKTKKQDFSIKKHIQYVFEKMIFYTLDNL